MITIDKIIRLDVADFDRCNEIWNMSASPYTEYNRKEIESGNRVFYIYCRDDRFIGAIACAFEMNDSDYTIPNKRICIPRLNVKREYRNKGIGSALIDFIIEKCKEMGYSEISIGVDKDNAAALHLYRKKGFTQVIFDGADRKGEYYKLLKQL